MYKITEKFEKWREEGSFFVCGFVILGVLAGYLSGAIYATTYILYYEQSPDGKEAIYEKCTNEICYGDGEQGANCHCKGYEKVSVPLGERIKDQIEYYGFLWGMIGFGPGALLGYFLWMEKKRKEKYEIKCPKCKSNKILQIVCGKPINPSTTSKDIIFSYRDDYQCHCKDCSLGVG